MKVLLVDDEEKFISSLAERLEIRGIDSDWVTNGDEAISKVKENTYDVAVLDIKMPGLSGVGLKGRLETIDEKLKFIFVTGHGSEEDYVAGCKEGCFYIIKPFKIDDLVEKLNETVAP